MSDGDITLQDLQTNAKKHFRIISDYPTNERQKKLSKIATWENVTSQYGSRSFAVAAPTTWNSLPLHIRNSSSIFGFRRQLKTFP